MTPEQRTILETAILQVASLRTAKNGDVDGNASWALERSTRKALVGAGMSLDEAVQAGYEINRAVFMRRRQVCRGVGK
jgi:hypothetical protein